MRERRDSRKPVFVNAPRTTLAAEHCLSRATSKLRHVEPFPATRVPTACGRPLTLHVLFAALAYETELSIRDSRLLIVIVPRSRAELNPGAWRKGSREHIFLGRPLVASVFECRADVAKDLP